MESGAADAGNYKGVMLCNRPTEQPSRPGQAIIAPEKPAFRPAGVGAEPFGLNPAKENLVSNMLAVQDEALRRRQEDGVPTGPPNFMNKHRAWLAEMARKKATLNAELAASAKQAEQKRTRFVAYTREMRNAVRQRALELQEMGEQYAASSKALPAESYQTYSQPAYFEQQQPEEVPPAMAPPSKGKGKAPAKPKWAMTEDEADAVEDDEAAQLLDFAQSLDYDSYIDDLEVRQALNVIRERIDGQKALEAAAAAAEEAAAAGGDWRSQFLDEWNAKDDDASTVRSSKRAPIPAEAGAMGEGDKPDWDASTRAGEETGPRVSQSARAMADAMLKENPNLREKHSVRSLAAMVEKHEPTVEELPPLRIVTVVENPKVNTKQIDPSNLPYLHRNPAV